MRHPDDSWTVTDVNIALADATADTQQRYRLKVPCYVLFLAAEIDVDDPGDITTTIETFGAVTGRTVETPCLSTVLERFDEFLHGGQWCSRTLFHIHRGFSELP